MPFDSLPITSPDIELLEKVRNLLKKTGWCQGTLVGHNENNRPIAYCLLGAYNKVNVSQFKDDHFAKLLGFDEAYDVSCWNDADGRTKRGVLTKLSKRISKLKAELLERTLTHERITS